jgi:TonB family protein
VIKPAYLVLVLLGMAHQIHQHTCDHAAPPPGMHYVCEHADSCNCRLQKDEEENEGAAEKSADLSANQQCASSTVNYFVAPTYPEEAWQAGRQGTVRAQVLVASSGTAEIKMISGDPVLAREVTEALKKWKFASSKLPRVLDIRVRFLLAGNPTAKPFITVSGASPLDLVVTAPPIP